MKPLEGQTALVTGATQGIGRATALALAGAGATVWINHLDQPEAATALVARIAASGGKAYAAQADVSVPQQVEDLFAHVLAEGDLHIRINGVAPGPVDTPMVSVEHMSEAMIARETAIPAGRLGKPEEIAAAVLFLVSPEASFFHGQILGANGGAWMGA